MFLRRKSFASKQRDENSPGFDRNRFSVNLQDLEEFICGICHEIFNNPLVTECCGQTYCSLCINQWLKNVDSNTCPNDRKQLTTNGLKEPSKAFKNLLSNLKINCDFQNNGCNAQVQLSELENHSKSCEYRPDSPCKRCGIQRDNVSSHNCLQSLRKANRTLIEEQVQLMSEVDLKLKRRTNVIKQTFRKDLNTFKVQLTQDIQKRFTDFEKNMEKSSFSDRAQGQGWWYYLSLCFQEDSDSDLDY